MATVQRYLQAKIRELGEQLAEMQSEHNNNSPEPQLLVQTNRLLARAATTTDTATRAATSTEGEQMAETSRTASMDCAHAQCGTAGSESTMSVEGCGTVAKEDGIAVQN